ncbi:MAG: PorT family protein [Bacteroidetes bacterium]|nr:PorT family protein [Bacteroidales bacterium]MBU1009399.1 PorT family protein [Bacteroidota bacterium]
MKKTILLFAMLLSVISLSAQFSFGPKIGYTTSKLSADQSDITSDLKNSFLYGAFVRLGSKVYLQPEINWYTSGSVFKSPSLGGGLSPIEQEINLKNIQIPLYIGFKLADLKLMNIRAQAGPTATIIVDKTIDSKSGGGFIAPIKEADISDLNWGFQFGAGIDVLMLTLDIQYYVGITKMIKEVEVPGITNPVKFDSRSQGFMVTLGWKIM